MAKAGKVGAGFRDLDNEWVTGRGVEPGPPWDLVWSVLSPLFSRHASPDEPLPVSPFLFWGGRNEKKLMGRVCGGGNQVLLGLGQQTLRGWGSRRVCARGPNRWILRMTICSPGGTMTLTTALTTLSLKTIVPLWKGSPYKFSCPAEDGR